METAVFHIALIGNRNYVEGGLLKIENRIQNTVSSMRKYHNFFCLFYSCDFSFRNKSAVISTIMKNNSESRSRWRIYKFWNYRTRHDLLLNVKFVHVYFLLEIHFIFIYWNYYGYFNNFSSHLAVLVMFSFRCGKHSC